MKLRIKELREKAGLTVEALAEQAGLSKSYMSEIQTGKKQANARVLENVARALGCSVIDLIDAQHDPAIQAHISNLSRLSPSDRDTVLGLAARLASSESAA